MLYYVGQFLGIVVSLLCLIGPFWKKKWQMLLNSAIANFLVILNMICLGEVGSAVVINAVAIVQIIISIIHVTKETKVSVIEKVIFLVFYVAFGFAGMILSPDFVWELSLRNLLELLPIIGAVFFSVLTFVRDEQATRKLTLANCTAYLVYYAAIGSTTVFAQLFGIITNIAALIKYRNKKA